MEISDDLENEDGYPFRSQGLENSHVADKRSNLRNTRYFIIKSLNHQNIQLSIEKGIWATQVMKEPILEKAFHENSSYFDLMQLYVLDVLYLRVFLSCKILNPLNDYKISRDCQELSQDVGEALCELLDMSNNVDVSLKRDDLA
ncbi:hypothetical protein V6N13_115983 [Hibiscus sabdariffa]